MDENEWLAGRFEASRARLRAVAYRMLGSLSEAEDAVQEAWIRAAGAGAGNVANLEGWLTTIVARVCLDMLRTRKSRREEPLAVDQAIAAAGPEQEAVLADSVGLAMLVVLDTLSPAERVAFVLHDMFGLPFGEIGTVTGRSPAATRQLASRARHRVRGTAVVPGTRPARQRELAAAFLAAARGGDVGALLSILDPQVELHADAASVPTGVPVMLRGAGVVARNALAASERSRYAALALVDGTPGIIVAPSGRLALVLAFTFGDDTITRIEVIADPDRLSRLDLAVLGLPATAVGSAGCVRDDHGERRDHQRHCGNDDRRGRRVPVNDGPGQDEQADADGHEHEVQALVPARWRRPRRSVQVPSHAAPHASGPVRSARTATAPATPTSAAAPADRTTSHRPTRGSSRQDDTVATTSRESDTAPAATHVLADPGSAAGRCSAVSAPSPRATSRAPRARPNTRATRSSAPAPTQGRDGTDGRASAARPMATRPAATATAPRRARAGISVNVT